MIDDPLTSPRVQVATPADLAAAREVRGLSPVDISQRIKLQVRQVNALEEGQWDALPGKSFVRGALRSYGKLLDVDVTALLDSIGGIAESTQAQSLRPIDSSVSRAAGLGLDGGSRGSPILWVIASLVGVVALVLYFGSGQDKSGIHAWLPADQTAPAAPVKPTPAAPLTQADVAAAAENSSDAGLQRSMQEPASMSSGESVSGADPAQTARSYPSGADLSSVGAGAGAGATSSANAGSDVGTRTASLATAVASELTPARSPAAISETTRGGADMQVRPSVGAEEKDRTTRALEKPAAGSENVKGAVKLSAVAQDSWVEVREVDGAILHQGVIKAGESLDLNGKPPYRLVIGNASNVELRYDGKVQALAPHTRANNIARLQLK